MEEKLYTTRESATILDVSPQMIYVAIKSGRLNKQKINGKVYISGKDLLYYQSTKYSRVNQKSRAGDLIYDHDKGVMNIPKAAKILNLPEQTLYYLVRTGHVPYKKSSHSYIINIHEAKKALDVYYSN